MTTENKRSLTTTVDWIYRGILMALIGLTLQKNDNIERIAQKVEIKAATMEEKQAQMDRTQTSQAFLLAANNTKDYERYEDFKLQLNQSKDYYDGEILSIWNFLAYGKKSPKKALNSNN